MRRPRWSRSAAIGSSRPSDRLGSALAQPFHFRLKTLARDAVYKITNTNYSILFVTKDDMNGIGLLSSRPEVSDCWIDWSSCRMALPSSRVIAGCWWCDWRGLRGWLGIAAEVVMDWGIWPPAAGATWAAVSCCCCCCRPASPWPVLVEEKALGPPPSNFALTLKRFNM